MRLALPLALLTALLLGEAAGCHKPPAFGRAAQSPAPPTTPGFVYPKGWPIKEVTVPPGATSTQGKVYTPLFDADSHKAEADKEGWDLFFEYGVSREEVISHFNQCLKPLGFLRFPPPPVEGIDYVAGYTNPQRTYCAIILPDGSSCGQGA